MPPEFLPPVTMRVHTSRAIYANRGITGPRVVRNRIRSNSRKAVRNFGKTGERLVKVNAPVRTGYLKSQVGHEVSDLGTVAEVFVDGNVTLKTGAFYAIYVEYGTRDRAARPFFWPAIRQAQKAFVAEMMRVFK